MKDPKLVDLFERASRWQRGMAPPAMEFRTKCRFKSITKCAAAPSEGSRQDNLYLRFCVEHRYTLCKFVYCSICSCIFSPRILASGAPRNNVLVGGKYLPSLPCPPEDENRPGFLNVVLQWNQVTVYAYCTLSSSAWMSWRCFYISSTKI